MSTFGLERILTRVVCDPRFEARLRTAPTAVLAEYDATAGERVALLAGDYTQLESFGVDPRISKWFTP